jgi:hypothetical protein
LGSTAFQPLAGLVSQRDGLRESGVCGVDHRHGV